MTSRISAAKPFVMLTLAVCVLASCGTRLNPFNWFGNSREVEVELAPEEDNPLIPERNIFLRDEEEVFSGVPIEQVTDLRIERTRTGAIILVEGVAARQGPYAVQLTPENEDGAPVDGVLSYSFDIFYPRRNTPIGSEATRRVTVAQSISTETLENTRIVRVTAAQNARETSRR